MCTALCESCVCVENNYNDGTQICFNVEFIECRVMECGSFTPCRLGTSISSRFLIVLIAKNFNLGVTLVNSVWETAPSTHCIGKWVRLVAR